MSKLALGFSPLQYNLNFTRLFIILIFELFCFYLRAISFSPGFTGVIIQCFDFSLSHCEVFYGNHSNSNNSFEIDLCLYAIYARFSLLREVYDIRARAVKIFGPSLPL